MEIEVQAQVNPYDGREQTEIKHLILRKYLERLTYKAGGFSGYSHRLCYVDCFAGPWKSAAEDLSDTSPSIALTELLKAKDGLKQQRSIDLTLKAMFIEKDQGAFQQLDPFVKGFDGVETQALQGEFEEKITEILQYAASDFTFFFIDPTGWSGFGMNKISPILKHRPGEVLINFMTDYIIRFIDSNQDEAGFIDLFGSTEARNEWKNLSGLEREEKIIQTYRKNLKKTGEFKYVVSAIILQPDISKTYFHLVYATRNDEGLRVFREVEQKAMAEQEKKRCEIQRKEQDRNNHPLLALLEQPTANDTSSETTYFVQLRNQYLFSSKKLVIEAIKTRNLISYDDLEMIALENTLTWQSDLQEWLQELKAEGSIQIDGMKPREKTVKNKSNHTIKWLSR